MELSLSLALEVVGAVIPQLDNNKTMTTTISELEKKRLENIERNAQYLSELGLASSSTTRTTSSNKSSSRRRPNTSTAAVVKAVVEIDPSLLRRSSRVAALAPVDYSEPAALPSSSSTKKRSFVGTEIVEQEESNVSHLPQDIPVGTFKGLSQQDDEVQQGEIKEDAHASSSSGSTSNTSCSTLNAQLSFILSTYLGKVFPDYGKASVMSESNGGKLPKFNKYPGVLEWKNCIYLWVNIGGSGGYTNNFFEKGKQMIWYGGSTMHSGKYQCFDVTNEQTNLTTKQSRLLSFLYRV